MEDSTHPAVQLPGNAGEIGGQFVDYLGLEFVELTGDRVVGTWVAGPHLHQPHGIVHGGAHCSVVETLASMGATVWLGEQGRVHPIVGETEGASTTTPTSTEPSPRAGSPRPPLRCTGAGRSRCGWWRR